MKLQRVHNVRRFGHAQHYGTAQWRIGLGTQDGGVLAAQSTDKDIFRQQPGADIHHDSPEAVQLRLLDRLCQINMVHRSASATVHALRKLPKERVRDTVDGERDSLHICVRRPYAAS
jgi:erythromycin esterase-like protein